MERLKKDSADTCFDPDVFICLAVLEITAVYYYGLRAFVVALVTAGSCVLCDIAAAGLQKKRIGMTAAAAASLGLMLSLMMPASVPYHTAAACGVFGECLAVLAFGGHGCEIFSGAAAGYVFGELCFPEEILNCPEVFSYSGLSLAVPDTLFPSFSKTMLTAATSVASDYEVLIGNVVSPMGTGVIVLLCAAGVFLICRRDVSLSVFISMTAVYGVFSCLYGGFFEVKYNLLSGMYLFTAVFAVCGSCPKTLKGRITYGAVTGALICVFRYFSMRENPIVYAALISSAMAAAGASISKGEKVSAREGE